MAKAKCFSIVIILALVFSLGVVMLPQSKALAQPPQYWAKTYGGVDIDSANSIQQTSDGGYIVAGVTGFLTEQDDFWVLKLDSNGDVAWQKTYDDGDSYWARSIQQTSDGGYIVAGGTEPFGAGDFWVLKLDSNGDVAWQKTYDGSDADWASSIQQTSDGGYIVAGMTRSFGAGGTDIWVLKLDSNGDVAWQKTYGGGGDDWAFPIQQTSDGGYIVAGQTESFGAGQADIWVLKLDSNGDVAWQKTYGGSDWDTARSIHQTSDGGYIVAGETMSFGAGQGDFWVLKLDSNGDVAWQKTYGGVDWDTADSIQQTSDGGYIVAGHTGSFGAGQADFWVLKLDSNGDVAWQKTYGGNDWDLAFSIQQTSDGGYIVAGYTGSFGAGQADFWVLKLDSSGNIPECPLIADSTATVTNTTATAPDTSVSGVDTAVTPVATSVTSSDTDCSIATQCYYSPVGYTVTFDTIPANTGEITFDGTDYIDGDATSKDAGTYDIAANPANGYSFTRWETEGNIIVVVPSLATTICIVLGDGMLRMVQTEVLPTVTFDTIPANTGEMTFDGTDYIDGDTTSKDAGTYDIAANPANGYSFTGWETEGNIIVVVPSLATTICTVSGDGILRMVQVQIGTIAWNFNYGPESFPSPSPANGRPYLGATVDLPTGTEPLELLGVYWLDEAMREWKHFIPGWGEDNTLRRLEQGQSYLVQFLGPGSWNLPCVEGTASPTGDIWNFDYGPESFPSPSPANGRPYLGATIDLPIGTEPLELLGVYWLDEATREWKHFIPGWGVDNTLHRLESGQAYLVQFLGPGSWNLA